ncbi:MAG: hypothetical protein ACUVTU_10480 [Desulfurispora sp.]|uniref:hypothetical protein n=1 Tax=Desulfurispora sp. TaxID=3014275 RepID=UPI00404B37E8
MSKPDLAIKRLLQRRAGDWLAYLVPESKPQQIRPYQTEFSPKLSSRLDSVLEVEEANGNYFLHIEPMAYRDTALPVRMLRYRSDIWETVIKDRKHHVFAG